MRNVSAALSFFVCLLVLAGCGGSAKIGPGTTIVNAPKRIFTIPFSAMEPTLHCAKPAAGCRGTTDDRVVVQPGKSLKRLDIVVFTTPPQAAVACGEGGIFVKRLIGLPGETVRQDDRGFSGLRAQRLEVGEAQRAVRLEGIPVSPTPSISASPGTSREATTSSSATTAPSPATRASGVPCRPAT